ncbi:hypothetical protein AVEN_95556-1 [Araneus ventricosus]|uniref:Mos1 transposase HTH domain-containing protein n=1 Tax=Araneus ventricosus TaxID=182803 RepID=A0A4Y2SKK0_ARAVE|nr:hypothetical protein AVEN_225434-1 [Araneus ventricosus]GBN86699.1 hypothetical protein AVEN_229614-1 [Araneus ventricosus]GBN87827.1 hypothetical protein AVEN_65938-1 [Araneus ventricosus]GBN87830.1 hypothetical protein AVEN_95556-1 [Araneus ventricosus]
MEEHITRAVFKSTKNPADSEIRSIARFLNAKNVKAAKIHRHISEACEENIVSKGMVRKLVTTIKDGRTHACDEKRRGRPSAITEDLVQIVDGKVRENRRFTISSLSNEFPQVSRRVLYGTKTERLNYRETCSLWAGGRFL